MSRLLLLIGLTLGPLWAFQLRANIALLIEGAPLPAPDLLALTACWAALRSDDGPAVAFGAASGLVSDVACGSRLGLLSVRDALLVWFLLRMRRVFYFESRPAVFLCVVLFVLLQRTLEASCLVDGARAGLIFQALPDVCRVALTTGVAALVAAPALDLFFTGEERQERLRRLG